MGGFQLSFSLGVLMGPLLAAPFVSKKYLDDNIEHNRPSNTNDRIAWPFIILGALLLLSAIILLVIYFYKPYIQSSKSSKYIKSSNLDKNAKRDIWSDISVTLFVLILGSFVG